MLVWTAATYLHSGQPDRTWPVPDRIAGLLMELWNSAEAIPDPEPPSSELRGCFLRDPQNHQWHAHGGVITLQAGKISESRRDRDGRFRASSSPIHARRRGPLLALTPNRVDIVRTAMYDKGKRAV